MLSGVGVQRSETLAESKHPYLDPSAAGRDSSLRSGWQLQAMHAGLHQFL